jgi:hypothetical protein
MRRTAWLLLLAACSTPAGTETSDKVAHDRTPDADRRYKEAAARGEVKYGMVREEVRKAWGAPKRTGRTTYKRKSVTSWSYPDRFTDIYFDDDGFVVGWHSLTG